MSDLLLDRIDHARRGLRGNLLLVGFCQVVAVLVATVAGFFIIDWLAINRILAIGVGDTIARVVLLLVALAVIGRVVWTTFLAEWRTRRDDDAIALKVELHHRQLGGRLISTVQLTRRLDEQGDESISADMVEGLVEQTEEAAGPLDFRGIVDRRVLKRMALVAFAVVLVAGGLAAWRPDYATALLKRMALLPVDYPTASRIKAVHHAGSVPEGETYPIEIELDPSGYAPETAEAQVRFANGRSVTITLAKVTDAPAGLVLFRGQVAQALDDFSFRPVAYDARWPRWEPVKTLRRPAVGGLSVTCTFPAYLNREPETTTVGDLRVPHGTEVAVTMTSTKPIADGILVQRLGNNEAAESPAAIAGTDRNEITGRFTVTASGTWSLRLVDADGLSPAQPSTYTISCLIDKPPVVSILAPRQDKLASPTAKWPLRFSVKDDQGLGAARLRYTVESADAVAEGAQEAPSVAIELPGLAMPGEKSVSKQAEFDLGRLNLQPGMRVTWWLEVADNRTPEPNLGVSQRLHFTIVDAETLRAEAERQRQELLDRINRIRDRQKEGRDNVDGLLKQVDGR